MYAWEPDIEISGCKERASRMKKKDSDDEKVRNSRVGDTAPYHRMDRVEK
jgi:hypothetical protein